MASGVIHVVACGSAAASAPEGALCLQFDGPSANLTVDISGIGDTLVSSIPRRFIDLIRIASYVLAADQAFSRGEEDNTDLGDRWRRQFKFIIPVEELPTWQAPEMLHCLESTLTFLSDDFYEFCFVPKTEATPEQLNFGSIDGEPFVPMDQIDAVQLFSGGMDSLTGAAERILQGGENVVLVSHRSASKIWKVQRDLVADLRKRSSPSQQIVHISVSMTKHGRKLRAERTQRSRSFLYAAIAGTVAHLTGQDAINFYENGIIGFNLPILPQVVGGRGTRTTHPEALRGFQKILSLLHGKPMRVQNPYEFMARSEVALRLKEVGGIELLRNTVSCAHVHSSSTMHPHCGVCSQCIDRRFATAAAGVEEHDPPEGYAFDILGGNHPAGGALSDQHRCLIIGYVASAQKFRNLTSPIQLQYQYSEISRGIPGLMERYDIDADKALHLVYALHKRHGEAVDSVISGLLSPELTRSLLDNTKPLPKDSLTALILSRGLGREQESAVPDDVSMPMPASPEQDIRIFISYSHDSAPHKKAVLDLASRLRADGLECTIDQHVNGSPQRGWPRWMSAQVEQATHVLVFCSSIYKRRFEGKEERGVGAGSDWEGLAIIQELYEAKSLNDKFIPVLFARATKEHIPLPLRPYTYYKLFEGYDDLYRQLTAQPKVVPTPIGKRRILPPESI
jgi:7-cyano-7-deazaguanine synthase in queuosine biosynthesis